MADVGGTEAVSALQLVTLVIAVVGLVLGAVGAVIQVLHALSDRVVVSVQASVAVVVRGRSRGPTQYAIKAYNGGRRPVTLVAAGFDLSRGQTISIMGFAQTRLEDGQAVDASVDIVELARAHVSPDGPVRAAWFRDAGGKKHRKEMGDLAFLRSWAAGE